MQSPSFIDISEVQPQALMRHPSSTLSSAILALAATLLAPCAQAQATRDFISIVGSSTVYPFSTVVAERFGRSTDFPTPKIESTGSGGGLKLFCSGVGVQYPDITNASRRIKQSEIDDCAANGVTDIIEVKIGYDGIVLANVNSAHRYDLTRQQIFLALARDIPDAEGAKLIPNNNQTWSDIDPDLPDIAIEVLGPPPTSGTRDAFVELVMDAGCESFPIFETLDEDARDLACYTMREDSAFIEAGENDNLIVQKLEANPTTLGVFGFSFLDQNQDKVQGALIDGVQPTFESIAEGRYPVSRPLFSYVKKLHMDEIPGMNEFLAELTSEAAWGYFGYLSDRGLIPLSQSERQDVIKVISDRTHVNLRR